MAEILGPIQLVVVGLENDKMTGQVARELHRATENGSIRIFDALAIQKTKEGSIISLGGSDLTPDQRVVYGAIMGGLLGFGATGTDEGMAVGAEMGADTFANNNFGFTGADIQELAQDIPAGSTALMVLFEHRWAIPTKQAIMDAGGVVLAQGMVRPETIMAIGAGYSGARFVPPDTSTLENRQVN